MSNFNLDNYEPVQTRLTKFYEKYPDGRVITELIGDMKDLSTVVFKAVLYQDSAQMKDNTPLSTGWATETKGDGYVNKTSHLENAETSAIGRALANIGLAGALRPSREEIEKAKPKAVGNRKLFDEYYGKVTGTEELKKLAEWAGRHDWGGATGDIELALEAKGKELTEAQNVG